MAHFLKQNPDETAQRSRGDAREGYLAAYLAYQMKERSAVKEISRTDSYENKKSKFEDVHWWSADKMDTELGSAKAQHWRDAKVLKSRPDSLTGSKDPQFIEYAVPQNWERLSESDLKAMKLNVSMDAGEAEAEHLAELSAEVREAPASSSSGAAGPVKTELTETQKLEKRAVHLQQEPTPVLRKFQDLLLESRVILTKVESGTQKEKQMASVLATDLGKQIARLGKVTKILERLCVEKGEVAEVMKLLSQIDECEKIHLELHDWALKFGFNDAVKPSKRARKKQ